ncbi:MAG: hypothetical protein EBT42_02370 [Actinobacteria bacterium]|nr:hypothetical protein [Actinomycetota bacterium]
MSSVKCAKKALVKLEFDLVTTENLEPNRRRGRARTATSDVKLPEQKPFKQPRMRYAPTKVLSDDEVESIHLASLRILSEYGMDFLDPDARNLLKKAGAKIIAHYSALCNKNSFIYFRHL